MTRDFDSLDPRRMMLLDLEFRPKLKRLFTHYYQRNIKALAADLGVDRSTVHRWLNDNASPNKRDREAVLRLYERKKAEEDEHLGKDLHKALRADDGKVYKRMRDIVAGPPGDEPIDDFVEELKDLIGRIRRDGAHSAVDGLLDKLVSRLGGLWALVAALWIKAREERERP